MVNELLDIVDELTLPKPVKIPTDDGHTWATEDALLVQLEDAIRSTTGRTGGRSADHTRMILDADALMQFHRITSTIGDWCRMSGAPVTKNPVTDLRAWYVSTLAGNTSTEFYQHQMQSWVSLIRSKLNPRTTLEILGPCPECGADSWFDEEGEEILHPVYVEYDPDAVMSTVKWSCKACGIERAGEFAQRYLAYSAETRQGDTE